MKQIIEQYQQKTLSVIKSITGEWWGEFNDDNIKFTSMSGPWKTKKMAIKYIREAVNNKATEGVTSFYLKIQQCDINNGKRRYAHECPTSLALARQLGLRPHDVCVGYSNARIQENWYNMSKRLRSAIATYDDGGKMEPSTYRLTLQKRGIAELWID